jgi:hypothetical protein
MNSAARHCCAMDHFGSTEHALPARHDGFIGSMFTSLANTSLANFAPPCSKQQNLLGNGKVRDGAVYIALPERTRRLAQARVAEFEPVATTKRA